MKQIVRLDTEFRTAYGEPLHRFKCKSCGFTVIAVAEPENCFCAS